LWSTNYKDHHCTLVSSVRETLVTSKFTGVEIRFNEPFDKMWIIIFKANGTANIRFLLCLDLYNTYFTEISNETLAVYFKTLIAYGTKYRIHCGLQSLLETI
jgi:hypothetical protein